jgi:hypothetical protein
MQVTPKNRADAIVQPAAKVETVDFNPDTPVLETRSKNLPSPGDTITLNINPGQLSRFVSRFDPADGTQGVAALVPHLMIRTRGDQPFHEVTGPGFGGALPAPGSRVLFQQAFNDPVTETITLPNDADRLEMYIDFDTGHFDDAVTQAENLWSIHVGAPADTGYVSFFGENYTLPVGPKES